MRRAVITFLKMLAAAELIYISAAIFFLNSGLLTGLINDREGDLKITYDFAYSLWPGMARASHLAIRVNDDDVQLYFHLHDLAVRIHLLPLFRREFVAERIKVDGLDFRLRLRRDKKELQSRIIPFLPPIPGLLPVKTPPSSAEAPNPHPWKVRLTDVRVDNLEEVWVEEYRYRGKMLVLGDLFLSPRHNTEVHKAVLVADTGKVTLGDSEVATDVHARIQASLGPYEKANFKKNNEILNYLSATVDGSAQVAGFEFLNHYLKGVEKVEMQGGVGPITTHLVLKNGRLVPPSSMKVQADDLKAAFWDQRAHGNAYIDWHIQKAPKAEVGRLSVLFPRFEIRHLTDTQGLVEGRDLSLLATTPDLFLGEPFQRLSVEVRTPEARITDLSYFEAYFPKGSRIRLHGGEGTLDAAVFATSEAKHKDTGYLHLKTRGVHLDLKAAELQGDITVDGVLHQGDLKTGRMDISGTQVYLKNVAALTHDEKFRNWWGNIAVDKGVLQLKEGKSFQADIRLKGRDGRPILGVATNNAIPGVLGGVLAFENLTAQLSLLVNDQMLSLSNAKAHGGNVTVKGWLKAGEEERIGKVLVEYGPTAAGIEIDGPDLEFKLNDAYGWYGEEPADER